RRSGAGLQGRQDNDRYSGRTHTNLRQEIRCETTREIENEAIGPTVSPASQVTHGKVGVMVPFTIFLVRPLRFKTTLHFAPYEAHGDARNGRVDGAFPLHIDGPALGSSFRCLLVSSRVVIVESI